MANPTTYFGWVMPTSSSLVTNLPADFNTFGQGVDTSMQDLLGGTTGQVLSKTSNTNMDFTWVTPTDQTPLTTKGDLFTFSTVDARLGVGTNGQTLVADSTAATGLKWATPLSGTFPVMRSANIAATFTTTSASYVDQTGYTLTFTPVSATNKVNISMDFQYSVNTTGANVEWQILRGATAIFYRAQAIAATGQYNNVHLEVTDTNVAASSQTYKLQVRINGGFTYTNYNDTVGFTGSQIRSLEVY